MMISPVMMPSPYNDDFCTSHFSPSRSAAALDIADRQNAHSMALAVRAVVELFRLVKREEMHREIPTFSV